VPAAGFAHACGFGNFERVRRFACFLAIACFVGSSGCSKVEAPATGGARHTWTIPGHLRIGMSDEPDNLNPMFAHTDATDQIDALIFAPVFRYDQTGEYVPELATAVPTYANGGISKDSCCIGATACAGRTVRR
jgi:ABC-type transport system substrate-binding protein